MKNHLEIRFIIQLTLAVIVSFAGAYYCQPLIHNNDLALNVIVTVFSVLAGFLVAIIAIIGDPFLSPPGSWRKVEGHRPVTIQRLVRHKWLFYMYLIALGLVFTSTLFKDFPEIQRKIEYGYLFFSILAFLCSLYLPNALMKLQEERIDHLIEDRRQRAKKGDAE